MTASPNALATAATSSTNSQIICASPNASGAPPMPVLGSGQASGLDDPVDVHRGSTRGINPATEGHPVGSALAGEPQEGDDNDDEEKITAPPKLTSDRKAREIPGNKMLTPAPENHGENRRQMDTPERGCEARTRGTRGAHRRHGQPGARVPAGAIESHQKAGRTRHSATSWNIPSWTIQTYVHWNRKAAGVEQRSTESLETEMEGFTISITWARPAWDSSHATRRNDVADCRQEPDENAVGRGGPRPRPSWHSDRCWPDAETTPKPSPCSARTAPLTPMSGRLAPM